jgi:hypothetical protein
MPSVITASLWTLIVAWPTFNGVRLGTLVPPPWIESQKVSSEEDATHPHDSRAINIRLYAGMFPDQLNKTEKSLASLAGHAPDVNVSVPSLVELYWADLKSIYETVLESLLASFFGGASSRPDTRSNVSSDLRRERRLAWRDWPPTSEIGSLRRGK